ncbi:hypothetical protein [Actinoplanes awajinensis]|uniref:Uncharacterized protein n=1 Tax=Actinoplanes awajinensis subsp. mycoplanecinus TaxID=135947 RepID=A0A124G757_9ACTN|nr:hypothetical protein [Actinoplanes awajinensis]KUL21595.1 hypothetical protein ADL15_50395 [Actinoplanes awajinensis subsp. mycoplanecinus]
MDVFQQLTDDYNRRARLVPAILVVLPIAILAVLAVPVLVTLWGKVAALLIAAGLPFVASQVVRDRGQRVQQRLYQDWQGGPAEDLLRWRSAEPRPAVARRHSLVTKHLGIELPDAAGEAAQPGEADDAYRTAVTALRERTRDAKMFPLVVEENIAYGFRRNTYACRIPAIVVCALMALVTLLVAATGLLPLGWKQQAGLVTFDVVAAAGWALWCTADAVHRAAQGYGRQLVAALEILDSDRQQA